MLILCIHSFSQVQGQGRGRERDKTTQAQAQQQHNSSNPKFHIPQTNTDCKTLANLLLHADLSYYKTHTHTKSQTKLHSTKTLVHKPKKKKSQRFHSPHVSAAGFESGSVSPALLDPKNDIVVFAVSVAPSFDRRQQ